MWNIAMALLSQYQNSLILVLLSQFQNLLILLSLKSTFVIYRSMYIMIVWYPYKIWKKHLPGYIG